MERFNTTLKAMLKKVLKGEKRDCDRMLAYVLLPYREVPQVTVRFSPFELLYGRDIRGPLNENSIPDGQSLSTDISFPDPWPSIESPTCVSGITSCTPTGCVSLFR